MSSPAGKRGRSEDGTAIPRTVDGRITEVAAAEQLAFWQGMEASVDGMLGGFGKLDPVDVSGSLDFIDELVPKKVDRAAAR
eukprot:gene2896-9236_t